MRCRLVVLIVSLLIAHITGYTLDARTKTARSSDLLFMKVDDDTLVVRFGSERIPFRPADFRNGDSIRLVFDDTSLGKEVLRLYAKQDSLEVQLVDTSVDVRLLANNDTIVTRFVLNAVKPRSHYLALLKDYNSFTVDSTVVLPQISYKEASESVLHDLRKEYQLDSISGAGDDVSRILNLLHWVHARVRHDGSNEAPGGWTSRQLLAQSADSQQGVNCGVLADIMNDVFLASGIKSRRIVCQPHDTADTECHSVNAVWSDQLRKWLWVDPTFEGVFKNADGDYLSIAEIRLSLANGDSLQIGEQLNWNGQPYDPQTYLAYIAKNLFCFAEYVHASLGQEPPAFFRISLFPTGYRSGLLV